MQIHSQRGREVGKLMGKMTEIKKLSDSEINKKLFDLKDELFNLRFRHKTNQLENPMRIRIVRKDIARIKTLINERRIAKTKG